MQHPASIARCTQHALWYRKCPAIPKPFPIKMQMRDTDFLAIGIAMRCREIEPGQDDGLAATGLVARSQRNAFSIDVEREQFSMIPRKQRHFDAAAKVGEGHNIIVRTLLLHAQKRIGIGLR